MSHIPLPLPAWCGAALWLRGSSYYLPPILTLLSQVLDYDYYGAYSRERHREYTYNQLLADEYTFDFPPHHSTVSAGWGHVWSWWG